VFDELIDWFCDNSLFLNSLPGLSPEQLQLAHNIVYFVCADVQALLPPLLQGLATALKARIQMMRDMCDTQDRQQQQPQHDLKPSH